MVCIFGEAIEEAGGMRAHVKRRLFSLTTRRDSGKLEIRCRGRVSVVNNSIANLKIMLFGDVNVPWQPRAT